MPTAAVLLAAGFAAPAAPPAAALPGIRAAARTFRAAATGVVPRPAGDLSAPVRGQNR